MYDNHTKQTWRGWAWNNIHLRAQKQKIIKPVAMCLAGDIAGDLEHARKRKIELVGVDYNNDCVINFRENGGIAVCDTLENQVKAFQPDIVFGDFLGGLTKKRFNEIVACAVSSKICCFNLLRGHDKDLGDHRKKLNSNGHGDDVLKEKHRGEWLIRILITSGLGGALEANNISLDSEFAAKYFNYFMKLANPVFYSYKSKDSNQYFDTVIFNSSAFSNHEFKDDIRKTSPLKSRHKAAAAKALITIKQNKCKTSP